ncbi:uncharacterized protein LOC124308918 [Neodiprion virginianus]|nr:uncharacterized protein LOC124224927 [Neodiprion pinetum]XP_046598002.1 uncharacterized protein LOC124294811 [Neodiprion lecontei]XP_046598743.1 uncharacterized protein LOC124294978 [Neodiprion lecontei]XP_046599132.1 uncharacterized protein LOC124295048 [Neodiprion lecontei]XP_046600379.1 uncharacterized protein LOC124295214 [Neodiprion lecontei]XP_046600741.1 uncharacterized protein LOC124295293 [Neodiprion lecontei]XP_046628044.1 uncharacterized protein LOC124308918 [Neodiprion virginia
MTSRLKNGRFVKKKVGDRVAKALTAMSEAKKTKILETLHETTQCKIPDGNCIVALEKLAKNLKCTSCSSLLDMEKMYGYNREGLHVKFKIKCDTCGRYNNVNTAESTNGVSDVNMSVVLGAIHAGVGNTGLNKILACANLPRVIDKIYKKYEVVVGQAIELEAKESCKRAASEEKELVIKNVKKLCDTL